MHLQVRRAVRTPHVNQSGLKTVFPPRNRIIPPAPEPYRPWQICGKTLTATFYAEPRAATSPPRFGRNENWRKRLCLQFASRLVDRVNVRTRRFRPTRLKPFACIGIWRASARRSPATSSWNATQVSVSAQDFAR